jgi:hypothetical protein
MMDTDKKSTSLTVLTAGDKVSGEQANEIQSDGELLPRFVSGAE